MLKIGILPFARPTFDIELAEAKLVAMLSALEGEGRKIIGPRTLLMGSEDGEAAISELQQVDIDRLLVLQVSFTDASLIVTAAQAIEAPLAIWAIPEPRVGGRLRLNSFCGLNLASHALGLRKHQFSWLYCDPDTVSREDMDGLFDGRKRSHALAANYHDNKPDRRAIEVAQGLRGMRIGRIGAHPDGFDTCAYDASKLKNLTGVSVDALELDTLFEQAAQSPDELVAAVRDTASNALPDLDAVDQGELDKSLRLKVALDGIREEGNYQAFALRCWPETFTEYGGAVCGPVSMLGENKIPCACEADVYGALTQLILQEVSQTAVFLTDLVDMDSDDNTGVVWHCGQAPISMRDKGVDASATIHTNRKMPLLYEFPLKAGRVTLMRISQSLGETKMILSGGEMLQRPMAFTGTSGVLRFDRPVEQVLPDMINSGLEHHMAIAYGDYRETLRGVAAALELPVLEI